MTCVSIIHWTVDQLFPGWVLFGPPPSPTAMLLASTDVEHPCRKKNDRPLNEMCWRIVIWRYIVWIIGSLRCTMSCRTPFEQLYFDNLIFNSQITFFKTLRQKRFTLFAIQPAQFQSKRGFEMSLRALTEYFWPYIEALENANHNLTDKRMSSPRGWFQEWLPPHARCFSHTGQCHSWVGCVLPLVRCRRCLLHQRKMTWFFKYAGNAGAGGPGGVQTLGILFVRSWKCVEVFEWKRARCSRFIENLW